MTATDPLLAGRNSSESPLSAITYSLSIPSMRVRLGDVMVLSRCEGEPQWVAQSILRAESTLASAERLRLLPPFSDDAPPAQG